MGFSRSRPIALTAVAVTAFALMAASSSPVVAGNQSDGAVKAPAGIVASKNSSGANGTEQGDGNTTAPSETKGGAKGCWRDGKWHPESTRIAVPLNSRLAVGGYTLCHNGEWHFVPK